MSDESARAAEILADHRDSIDRLDAILVYTLGERFKHTQAVGRLKAKHDLPPSDPAREERQIERLEWLAKEADLDPKFAKKFLNFVISEVIRHHENLTTLNRRGPPARPASLEGETDMATKIRLARGGSKKRPSLRDCRVRIKLTRASLRCFSLQSATASATSRRMPRDGRFLGKSWAPITPLLPKGQRRPRENWTWSACKHWLKPRRPARPTALRASSKPLACAKKRPAPT